jgi:hypothetical protein
VRVFAGYAEHTGTWKGPDSGVTLGTKVQAVNLFWFCSENRTNSTKSEKSELRATQFGPRLTRPRVRPASIDSVANPNVDLYSGVATYGWV